MSSRVSFRGDSVIGTSLPSSAKQTKRLPTEAGSRSFGQLVRDGSADGAEALGEATGVGLLGAGQRLQPLGDVLEALVASRLGEARVHLGVLVGLAGDGRLEVVGGGADGLTGDGIADRR